LVHIHACENDRGIPGTGHIDWNGITKAFKETRYNRYVVFETLLTEVRQMISASCAWRNIFPGRTTDEAAKETLEFLKQKFD